jgi:hypothetical protein
VGSSVQLQLPGPCCSFIMVSVHLLGELFWRREELCADELSIVCSVNTCVLSVGCTGGADYLRLVFHISG